MNNYFAHAFLGVKVSPRLRALITIKQEAERISASSGILEDDIAEEIARRRPDLLHRLRSRYEAPASASLIRVQTDEDRLVDGNDLEAGDWLLGWGLVSVAEEIIKNGKFEPNCPAFLRKCEYFNWVEGG